jgi:hypothetical protein
LRRRRVACRVQKGIPGLGFETHEPLAADEQGRHHRIVEAERTEHLKVGGTVQRLLGKRDASPRDAAGPRSQGGQSATV